LAIIPLDEWYLSAGLFDPPKSFENWARKAQAAEAHGFTGARTTGNPFWLQTEEEWAQFLRYEGTVNRAIESQRVISLCTYPVNICTSRHMLGTFSTHHAMLMTHGDHGSAWICDRGLQSCRTTLANPELTGRRTLRVNEKQLGQLWRTPADVQST
jgi:MEDS: MEthanogen/methylotroph, DcmR Sensory domain